jgi:thioredoxin
MPRQLSKAEFSERIFDFEHDQEWRFAGSRPCVVDFHADWCQPCKLLSPVLDELLEEYRGQLDIYGVNIGDEPELATVFRIRSIPTMLFVPVRGNPRVIVGVVPKATIQEAIARVFGIQPPGAE